MHSAVADNNTQAETSGGRQQAQPSGQRLRLLSYNIQTGSSISQYRHYVTQSWKHVLPHRERMENLHAIARMARGYDIVGLQEVDAGSLRSGFINQTEYLADKGQFPYWYHQTTRKLGVIAQHSNGFLSRFRPSEIDDHKLPGAIPGRGALFIRYGSRQQPLVIIILHLALGRRSRLRQLAYVADVACQYPHVIIMGDLNCQADSRELRWLLRHTDLCEPLHDLFTFPSWRPERNIDHILVSRSLTVRQAQVLDQRYSDHLPLAMEVALPDGLHLASS